jgi:cytochrome P450
MIETAQWTGDGMPSPPGPKLGLDRVLFNRGGPGEQLRILPAAARDYGPVVGFRFRNRIALVLLHDPAQIRHVLRTNSRNYLKAEQYEPLKLVVGEGLIVSDGDFWRHQRRLEQPAFHRRRIAGLASLMVAETARTLSRWSDPSWGQGEPFDVVQEMTDLTLRIISKTLLGPAADRHLKRISNAQSLLDGYLDRRMATFVSLPYWVPTPANLRYRRALANLHGVIDGAIDERKLGGQRGDDLLSMLLEARDERTGQGMDRRQLRDEAMTLLFAGHETTATALSWTWWLLGTNAVAESRLHDELDGVLAGRMPEFEDLPNLPYTRMVLQEAMRLYPPAWAISRRAIEDDEVGGYLIPAGTTVLVSPYVTHRNPRYWEHSEIFDPERFLPQRSAGRPEFAYLPFGGGPRKCIGDHYAMTEGVLILATIAQRYRLLPVPEHPVEPQPLLTLKPKRGIFVSLEERRIQP